MTTPGLTMCRANQTNTPSLYENLYASTSTNVIFTGKLTGEMLWSHQSQKPGADM